MRRLIGSGWKMNLTSTDARRYFETLLPLVDGIDGADLLILPPFTSLFVAHDLLEGTQIHWGAQDVHPDDWGAHTGDISAPMLADLGCSFVEVGHAERRRDHHETEELIAAKIDAVLRWGMTPILCVGETERLPLSKALDFLHRQLETATSRDLSKIVIAYEPVWAIGTGATAAEATWVESVHSDIHTWLSPSQTEEGGPRVVYGGSVDLDSALKLLHSPGVDGLFIGRSALDPVAFARIVRAACSDLSSRSDTLTKPATARY
jgi:triosephosphate isomerase